MAQSSPPAGNDEFSLSPRRIPKLKDKPADIPDYVADNPASFTLHVADRVITGLRHYCRQYPQTEVGGALFGRHYVRGDRVVVEVTEHLPLPSQDSSRAHFTYDTHAVVALHKTVTASNSYFVGWFHSHPGWGDPFMSAPDRNLHMENCKEPWYVSAVVAVGEWSLPIGFYRMEGKKLIHIEEHYVHMTRGATEGEQSRLFLQACLPEDRPLDSLCGDLDYLSASMGFTADSEFARLVGSAKLHLQPEPDAVSPLAPLWLLLAAGRSVAAQPALRQTFDQLEARLERVRFYEDAALTLAESKAIQQRIFFYDHFCLSFSPGEAAFHCLDLKVNLVWKLQLTKNRKLADAVGGWDGTLWLITQDGDLLLFQKVQNTAIFMPSVSSEAIPCTSFKLPFESSPLEVVMLPGALLVRMTAEVCRLEFTSKDAAQAFDPRPAQRLAASGGSRIFLGPAAEGLIIETEAGGLKVQDMTGAVVRRFSCPADWRGWQVLQACWCPAGLFVLFDDGIAGQVVQFDYQAGSVLAQHLEFNIMRRHLSVTAIGVDQQGRVFIKQGDAIRLLLATGAADPQWHVAKKQELW